MSEYLSVEEIAALCTNTSNGCFGDNIEVLRVMLDMDDGGVRKNLEDSGLWGFKAAQDDIAIKGLNLRGKPIAKAETGPHDLDLQAALCGYHCGAIATGTCAVFKPSAFKSSPE